MVRKATPQQELDEATLAIVPGRKSRGPKQKLIDPQAPLPGAMKRVGPRPEPSAKEIKEADPKHLREKFDLYCRLLAEHYGEPVPALAAVFGISLEEAAERQAELHNEITRATSAMTQRDLFSMLNISKEHRTARLKTMMYCDNPAVSLKAMDMLNDMDGNAKSSGDTWEEWIALAIKQK